MSTMLGAAIYIPECIKFLGGRRESFFREFEINSQLFSDVDNDVPLDSAAQMLDFGARSTSCDAFGLMVGLCGGLHVLGSTSQEMQSAGQVRHAIQILIRSFSSLFHGAYLNMIEDGDEAIVRFVIFDPEIASGEQVTDCAVAFIFQVLRDLCGQKWQARAIRLPRRCPADPQPFVSGLSSAIQFNSPIGSISFDVAWLNASPIAASSPVRRVEDASHQISPDEIEGLCLQRLLDGLNTSSHTVARILGVSRRTLHRRLATKGLTYQRLLDRTRYGAALRLLRDTDLTATQIGMYLGYSEVSAFTRAFHNWTGFPPTQVRSTPFRDPATGSVIPRVDRMSARLDTNTKGPIR